MLFRSPPGAPRPAPRARRPPPPASGGRSGRLAALRRSEAGWGAPPRPRPGVFRVLRGPQLAARPGPARPGPARRGKEQRGRAPGHTTSRIQTGPDPSASHPSDTHGGCAAGRHVAEELAVAAAGTTRGPGCAVATQRPASSHAKGWGRWTAGRPGTRRRPDDGRPRRSAPAPREQEVGPRGAQATKKGVLPPRRGIEPRSPA